MAEIIIYPGSFNPVHKGHIAVANYVAGSGLCDELWLSVSPHNPLKRNEMLAPEQDRLEMVRIALKEEPVNRNISVTDIETTLPTPSYTVDTLCHLEKTYPGKKFSLLIGTDILPEMHRWREINYLLDNYRIYVYPRKGSDFEQLAPGMKLLTNAPVIEISATAIRETLERGGYLGDLLSPGVIGYIYDRGLWVPDAAARRLEVLDRELETTVGISRQYMERGRLNYKFAEYGPALNDFLKVRELEPANKEAGGYIKLLQDIFEYRNMDIYNP
ncbi:MAG: nicotinate (nicotinamide) nucleotide adenylyltransferase [Alistipes sp.]|nr:nicotinate (nicotinamide) nucleotide adenylyltransferase [Alistipes sp.]